MEQTTASTTRPSSNHGGGYSLDNLTTSTPRRDSVDLVVDKERPPSDTIVVNYPPPTAGSRNSNSSNKKASSSSSNAQYCYRQPTSQFRSTPTTTTVKQHAPPTTTRTTTTTREEPPPSQPSPYQNMEYQSSQEFINAPRGRQRNNKNKKEEPSVASTKTRSTSSSSTEFFQHDNIIEEEDEDDEEVPSSTSTRRRRKRSKSKPTRKKKTRRGRRKDRNRENDTDEENPYSTDHRPMTAVPEEGDSCIEELDEETKTLFRRAADYIQPSSLFRLIVHLYGERKLVVFFWLHFVATMAIWVHFGLIKWDEQRATVPDGAPNYWWKRIAPPLEFGSMHAILFQMALLPLTMSRFSIAALSDSLVDRFIPMNRMLRIHIHLGYTMVRPFVVVFVVVVGYCTIPINQHNNHTTTVLWEPKRPVWKHTHTHETRVSWESLISDTVHACFVMFCFVLGEIG